jgi:CRP/FNR family transcriptional regulator, cyclic AMP receptor protein
VQPASFVTRGCTDMTTATMTKADAPAPDRKAADAALSLAGVKMLRDLAAGERAALESKCTFRRFAPGDVVLDRFSPSAAVYFMISGAGRVVHYVSDEQEITIATVAAGDTIGEISAIDGLGRSATVVAEENCVVAELPSVEFHALLIRHGDLALELLRRWAATIRQLSDKVSLLSTGSPEQRVYSEIIRLARAEKPGSDRWVIRELPTHQELARWAQTSREVVAGAVAELVRRGVAERKTKTLYVNDYPALREMMSRRENADGAGGGQ